MTGVDITRGVDHLRENRPFNRDVSINGGLSVIVGALKCHPYVFLINYSLINCTSYFFVPRRNFNSNIFLQK